MLCGRAQADITHGSVCSLHSSQDCRDRATDGVEWQHRGEIYDDGCECAHIGVSDSSALQGVAATYAEVIIMRERCDERQKLG